MSRNGRIPHGPTEGSSMANGSGTRMTKRPTAGSLGMRTKLMKVSITHPSTNLQKWQRRRMIRRWRALQMKNQSRNAVAKNEKSKDKFDMKTHIATPDKDHHDTKTVYKLALPRKVAASAWNDRLGLTGRDPLDVKLWEVSYGGKNAHAVRLMANAVFHRFEICNSLEEHGLCRALLNMLRKDDCPINLKRVLKQVARANDLDSSTKYEKMIVWEKVVEEIIGKFQEMSGKAAAPGSNRTIDELMAQIKALQEESAKLKKPDPMTTNTPGASSSGIAHTTGTPQVSLPVQQAPVVDLQQFLV